MLKVTIVVGNPKPNSRTLQIAQKLASGLLGSASADLVTIDLTEYHDRLFVWTDDTVAALSKRVAGSDLIIVASPTYKATYTGLLKAFLDRYATNGLQGVIAIPLMTGGSAGHSMAPDSHLAPLLSELGAVVLGRSLYFVTEGHVQIDDDVAAGAAELRARLAKLKAVASAVETDA